MPIDPNPFTFPPAGASLLVAEFLAGGGWWAECGGDPPSPSLLREGAAMLAALADDAVAAGLTPVVLLDARLVDSPALAPKAGWEVRVVRSPDQERTELERLGRACAATIVLAPETAGWLETRARWADAAGARRLGATLADLRIAGDKQLTAARLAAAAVPIPRGGPIASGEPFPIDRLPPDLRFPLVVKPRDGAGATDVHLLRDFRAVQDFSPRISAPLRWEEFAPGLSASVACLCGPPGVGSSPDGPARVVALPACRQHVRDEGGLRYFGGSLPLPDALDRRARRLAERAVRTLDAPRGWIGVDLVLGDAPDGSGDVAIEINPRYTTSLVGLRVALDANLLDAALRIAAGLPTPDLDAALSRPPRPVEFEPDGTVRPA